MSQEKTFTTEEVDRIVAGAREEERALHGATLELLRATDMEIFVGTHWTRPFDVEAGIRPVLAANVWSFGADAERIPDEDIPLVLEAWRRFGSEGIQAWVCARRGRERPMKGDFGEKGEQAIAWLLEAKTASKGAMTAVEDARPETFLGPAPFAVSYDPDGGSTWEVRLPVDRNLDPSTDAVGTGDTLAEAERRARSIRDDRRRDDTRS